MSGPNLNETSIVSGGYGGSGDGLIPTGMNGRDRLDGWGVETVCRHIDTYRKV